jgi:multidrug efflux pump subunit AcrB
MLTIGLGGMVALATIPADILPAYKSPAVQVLTFYGGMSATNVEADITARMERWVGQAAGTRLQESRSMVGASVIRNYYTDDTDPSAALTQVNSLATASIPSLPPGTLPPVILPYDPTSATPVALVALNSKTQGESVLFDTGRYQVRSMIMAQPGANAPVVYGGRSGPSSPIWTVNASRPATSPRPTSWTPSTGRTSSSPPATRNSAGSTTPSTRTRCST